MPAGDNRIKILNPSISVKSTLFTTFKRKEKEALGAQNVSGWLEGGEWVCGRVGGHLQGKGERGS